MNILKSAKQKAIDEAKRTVKDVSEELKEIPGSATSQITGNETRKAGLFSKSTQQTFPRKPEIVDMGSDIGKFPGTVSEQLFGKKHKPTERHYDATGGGLPSIVEAMLQKSDANKPDEAEEVQKPVSNLEKEMEMERRKREEREKKWEEEQERKLSEQDEAEDATVVVALPSSRRKGPGLPGAGSPKSPETRKSKQ